jgi:hypothetical protein
MTRNITHENASRVRVERDGVKVEGRDSETHWHKCDVVVVNGVQITGDASVWADAGHVVEITVEDREEHDGKRAVVTIE